MKARITHLKAPWPSGAVVGSVVLFEVGSVPEWAVGKCVPAGEDDEPEHVVPAPRKAEAEAKAADPQDKPAAAKKK